MSRAAVRRATVVRATVVALLATFAAAAPEAAQSWPPRAEREEIERLQPRFQGCSPDHPYRQVEGPLLVAVERAGGGKRIPYLLWELKPGRRVRWGPHELRSAEGCQGRPLSKLGGGVATFRCRENRSDLVVSHPRWRGCTLEIRLRADFPEAPGATELRSRPPQSR